jgi:hypothetical protein
VTAALNLPLTGGCQCGAVRYRITAAPEDVHLCHCRMCQKAMGNAFAALAPVRAGTLVWTRGNPAAYASSSTATRQFCAQCGTPLGFRYIGEDRPAITIGSLDNPEAIRPAKHYGTEARVSWLHDVIADGLPEEQTDLSVPELDGIINFQHPDHDTET